MQKRRNVRIPRLEWPTVWDRYQAGESFIAIAQSYDTSVETIRYIVKEMRKSQASPSLGDGASAGSPDPAPTETPPPLKVVARRSEAEREGELPRVVMAALHCAEAYETWREDPDPETANRLVDSVHAVKRALAAIEIELAKGAQPSPAVGERRHRYPTSAYSRG